MCRNTYVFICIGARNRQETIQVNIGGKKDPSESSVGGGQCSQHAVLAASLSVSPGNELAITTEDTGLVGKISNLKCCSYLL